MHFNKKSRISILAQIQEERPAGFPGFVVLSSVSDFDSVCVSPWTANESAQKNRIKRISPKHWLYSFSTQHCHEIDGFDGVCTTPATLHQFEPWSIHIRYPILGTTQALWLISFTQQICTFGVVLVSAAAKCHTFGPKETRCSKAGDVDLTILTRFKVFQTSNLDCGILVLYSFTFKRNQHIFCLTITLQTNLDTPYPSNGFFKCIGT